MDLLPEMGSEYLDERDSVKLSQLYDNLFATFLEENQAKEIKIEVEENYHGLKFGEKFEENDFNDMINDFRQNRKKFGLVWLHSKI